MKSRSHKIRTVFLQLGPQATNREVAEKCSRDYGFIPSASLIYETLGTETADSPIPHNVFTQPFDHIRHRNHAGHIQPFQHPTTMTHSVSRTRCTTNNTSKVPLSNQSVEPDLPADRTGASTWEYQPIIISSQVWSPQWTVLVGSGLAGLSAELSKWATHSIVVPLGIGNGLANR